MAAERNKCANRNRSRNGQPHRGPSRPNNVTRAQKSGGIFRGGTRLKHETTYNTVNCGNHTHSTLCSIKRPPAPSFYGLPYSPRKIFDGQLASSPPHELSIRLLLLLNHIHFMLTGRFTDQNDVRRPIVCCQWTTRLHGTVYRRRPARQFTTHHCH